MRTEEPRASVRPLRGALAPDPGLRGSRPRPRRTGAESAAWVSEGPRVGGHPAWGQGKGPGGPWPAHRVCHGEMGPVDEPQGSPAPVQLCLCPATPEVSLVTQKSRRELSPAHEGLCFPVNGESSPPGQAHRVSFARTLNLAPLQSPGASEGPRELKGPACGHTAGTCVHEPAGVEARGGGSYSCPRGHGPDSPMAGLGGFSTLPGCCLPPDSDSGGRPLGGGDLALPFGAGFPISASALGVPRPLRPAPLTYTGQCCCSGPGPWGHPAPRGTPTLFAAVCTATPGGPTEPRLRWAEQGPGGGGWGRGPGCRLGLRCQLVDTGVLCGALSCPSCFTRYRSLTRPFPSISSSWLMALAAIDPQRGSILVGHVPLAPDGWRGLSLHCVPPPLSLAAALSPPSGPWGGKTIPCLPPSHQGRETFSLALTHLAGLRNVLVRSLRGGKDHGVAPLQSPQLPVNLARQAPTSGALL